MLGLLTLGLPPGRPFWDDGHPSTWKGFERVVTGSDFAPHQAVASLFSATAIHGVVDDFAPLAEHDFGGLLPWLALFGGVMLWWRVPLVLAGGLGGTLETGRALSYLDAGEDNRKMCSLYLSLMDRFGIKLEQFGDAQTRLERL